MSCMGSLRPDPELDRRQVRIRILGAVACLSVLIVSYVYAPYKQSGPVLCPLRLFSGLPCPGCGLTRAFCSITHGHLVAAVRFHAFSPLVFLGFLVAIIVLPLEAFRRRRLRFLNRILFSPTVAQCLLVSLITYHVIRLIYQASNGQLMESVKHSILGFAIHAVTGWL